MKHIISLITFVIGFSLSGICQKNKPQSYNIKDITISKKAVEICGVVDRVDYFAQTKLVVLTMFSDDSSKRLQVFCKLGKCRSDDQKIKLIKKFAPLCITGSVVSTKTGFKMTVTDKTQIIDVLDAKPIPN
ncbi:hypothetical protein [Mucilaginibacter myungsuensis]|uniref:Uncharacterized protein n=1 Tax=Mucilaginibacter myungsuensis TaxID=649104 RepID=A0A929PWV3_9SPHI|nr:hypothetical protein [Mucilaginibacter myungsuensis]MBE9662524.1 hypothetical protein [Mucilaginibacter myungsuensis]MDN3597943.1 hypothetical protein [Mucilaginibacter myungsuensis]